MKGKAILIVTLIEDVAKVLKERTNLTYTTSVHKQQDTDVYANKCNHQCNHINATQVIFMILNDLSAKMVSEPFP